MERFQKWKELWNRENEMVKHIYELVKGNANTKVDGNWLYLDVVMSSKNYIRFSILECSGSSKKIHMTVNYLLKTKKKYKYDYKMFSYSQMNEIDEKDFKSLHYMDAWNLIKKYEKSNKILELFCEAV